MRETLNTTNSTNKFTKWIRNASMILALCAVLAWCESMETRIEKQTRRVAELEYMLQKQAENYHRVAIQENIQQDLKEEGADHSINQEIGYALNYADDQDVAIAKTKRKLNREQRKLARMIERSWWVVYDQKSNEERLNHRLKTEKYDYIPEEYKRSREAEDNEINNYFE